MDGVSARAVRAKAAVTLIVVGLPLLFLFGRAAADGIGRAREVPVRAVLGNDTYERLQRGERTRLHYLGRDRLAPSFTLSDRNGRPWSLDEHRGKVIVLNFWSITCAPCVRELPTLEALARMADEDWGDVEVVGISTDSGWDAVRTVVPENPRMTILFDPEREVVRDQFGTELFPETWIIDREGVIRFRYDGEQDWASALMLDVIDRFR